MHPLLHQGPVALNEADLLDAGPSDAWAHNLALVYELIGALDLARLAAAYRWLAERHESFRTSFVRVGGSWERHVQRESTFELEISDLTGEADPESAARARIQPLLHTPFDRSRAPLLRVLLLRLGPTRQWVLNLGDHVVLDGVSFATATAELMLAYFTLEHGGLPDLPAPRQPREHHAAVEAALAPLRATPGPWSTPYPPDGFRLPPTPIVARYAHSKGRAPSTPGSGEAGRSVVADSFGPTNARLASPVSAVDAGLRAVGTCTNTEHVSGDLTGALPPDPQLPGGPDPAGARHLVDLGDPAPADAMARALGVSRSAPLLAAMALGLRAITGRADPGFTLIRSGRRDAASRAIVGCLAWGDAWGTWIGPGEPYAALLRRAHAFLEDAHPGRMLTIPLTSPPTRRVVLNINRYETSLDLPGLTIFPRVEIAADVRMWSSHDLLVQVFPLPGAMFAALRYRTSVLSPATVERLGAAMAEALRAMAADPHAPVP
jgi:hypothetical protein